MAAARRRVTPAPWVVAATTVASTPAAAHLASAAQRRVRLGAAGPGEWRLPLRAPVVCRRQLAAAAVRDAACRPVAAAASARRATTAPPGERRPAERRRPSRLRGGRWRPAVRTDAGAGQAAEWRGRRALTDGGCVVRSDRSMVRRPPCAVGAEGWTRRQPGVGRTRPRGGRGGLDRHAARVGSGLVRRLRDARAVGGRDGGRLWLGRRRRDRGPLPSLWPAAVREPRVSPGGSVTGHRARRVACVLGGQKKAAPRASAGRAGRVEEQVCCGCDVRRTCLIQFGYFHVPRPGCFRERALSDESAASCSSSSGCCQRWRWRWRWLLWWRRQRRCWLVDSPPPPGGGNSALAAATGTLLATAVVAAANAAAMARQPTPAELPPPPRPPRVLGAILTPPPLPHRAWRQRCPRFWRSDGGCWAAALPSAPSTPSGGSQQFDVSQPKQADLRMVQPFAGAATPSASASTPSALASQPSL